MPRSRQPLTVVMAPDSQINHPDRINYHLRLWAAEPLQRYKIERRRNQDHTLTCALEECPLNEPTRLVGSWRHQDAPWLYPFLSDVLRRLHAAHAVAAPHLKGIERRRKTKSPMSKRAHKKRDKMIKDGKLSNGEIAIVLQRAGYKIGVTAESVRQRRKKLANLVTSLDTPRK